MTDLAQFILAYKNAGITINQYNEDNKIKVELNGYHENTTDSEKFTGAPGSFSVIEFSLDGQFLIQCFYDC